MRKPSPAMVVAFVALVAALSGSAAALPGKNKVDRNDIKRNAVTGKSIKNNSVKGADVDESSLAQVPSAGTAANASDAQNAANAQNASALGGQPPSAYAASTVEPVRFVGAPGQPDFLNDWAQNPTSDEEQPGFYKDPLGIVHLVGAASGTVSGDIGIFRLPPGYRPAKVEFFQVFTTNGDPGAIEVDPDGLVTYVVGNLDFVGLANASFRAAG